MSKELEALEKLNHTICLNNCDKTLKFGIDDDEHIDCKDVYEFAECYNTIKSALERKEKLERFAEHYDKYRNKLNNLTLACKEMNNQNEQLSNRLEKLEEVIEIIKKDRTLAELDFKYSYEEQCEFYYNNYYEVFNREPEEKFYCAKEEYELLKEIFK